MRGGDEMDADRVLSFGLAFSVAIIIKSFLSADSRDVTSSSSYLELPNSTWPFSSKVHEITKFRISWSNS